MNFHVFHMVQMIPIDEVEMRMNLFTNENELDATDRVNQLDN